MEEEKLTLAKTLVAEIKAQANLKSSFQVAKVLIVPKSQDYPAKVGLEIKLVPITSDMKIDEERFKPRSFFVIESELQKLDALIKALVKARFMFILQNKQLTNEEVEMMKDYFLSKIKEAIEDGVNEVQRVSGQSD